MKFLKISRSGYCAWKKRKDDRQRKAEIYAAEITKIFSDGKGTYGADRVCGELRKNGYKASFKRVKAIMEQLGLKSIHCRRRQRSLTDSRKAHSDDYVNLVKDMKITEPFQVISSDISYVRTGEGFEYVCQIRDVVSGIVLAHTMSDHMKAELVVDAIKRAVGRYGLPAGCIFHSDRGSQYTSEAVKHLLASRGILQSFSRVGKPGDNSWSESFFANMKKEAVHWRFFKTRIEAREAIFAYIEGFYNSRRIQKRLGYLSPLGWLKHHLPLFSRTVA